MVFKFSKLRVVLLLKSVFLLKNSVFLLLKNIRQ